MRLDGPGCALPRRAEPRTFLVKCARGSKTAGTGLTKWTSSAPWTLGIHPYVHAGRTRRMRHGLPHARRIGRGMLLLLLPLRAFGHGRAGKFVDRTVAAGTLENPIAAGVDHSRHLAVAWHILPAVPGVPLRIDLGGDGHTANLQHRRHATLRHFDAVRVNLFPDNAC